MNRPKENPLLANNVSAIAKRMMFSSSNVMSER